MTIKLYALILAAQISIIIIKLVVLIIMQI